MSSNSRNRPERSERAAYKRLAEAARAGRVAEARAIAEGLLERRAEREAERNRLERSTPARR
jgi:hypothetical protein